jgi:metal-responsive CopG/Arc/MetJ family transcriptional regulator
MGYQKPVTEKPVEFGIEFPRHVIEEIDRRKGFYSRNKYILRAVLKAMADEDKGLTEDNMLLQIVKERHKGKNE